MGKRRTSNSPGDAVGPLCKSPRIKLEPPISHGEIKMETQTMEPAVLSYIKEESNIDSASNLSGSNYAEKSDSATVKVKMEIAGDTGSSNISNEDQGEMKVAAELGPADDQSKVSNDIQNIGSNAVPPNEERKKKKRRNSRKKKSGRACPICCKFKTTFIVWPCRHRSCKPCIVDQEERNCPVCKGILNRYLPTHLMGGEKWEKQNVPDGLSPRENRHLG